MSMSCDEQVNLMLVSILVVLQISNKQNNLIHAVPYSLQRLVGNQRSSSVSAPYAPFDAP